MLFRLADYSLESSAVAMKTVVNFLLLVLKPSGQLTSALGTPAKHLNLKISEWKTLPQTWCGLDCNLTTSSASLPLAGYLCSLEQNIYCKMQKGTTLKYLLITATTLHLPTSRWGIRKKYNWYQKLYRRRWRWDKSTQRYFGGLEEIVFNPPSLAYWIIAP